jgi:hypothetical protein
MAGAALAHVLGGTAIAAIQEEAVTYKAGDTTMKGFIVYDDAQRGQAAQSCCPRMVGHHQAIAKAQVRGRRLHGVADMRRCEPPTTPGYRRCPARCATRRCSALPTAKTPGEARYRGCLEDRRGGLLLRRLGGARHGAGRHRPQGVAAFHAGLGAAGPQAPGKVS